MRFNIFLLRFSINDLKLYIYIYYIIWSIRLMKIKIPHYVKLWADTWAINITSCHNYTTFYYSIFKDLRDQQLRIFELRLGTNNVNIPSNMGAIGRPWASL